MITKFMIALIFLLFDTTSISADSLRTRACEHDKLTLECLKDKSLRIISANYGRLSKNVCANSSINKICKKDVLDVVKISCEGQNNCEVIASNHILGDPCHDTFKYLEVEYICSNGPKISRICQNKTLYLNCSDEKVLKIVSANYGRTNRNICSYFSHDNCKTPGAFDIVKEICDGYTKCGIHASDGIFGDPCPYIAKYLEVEYGCINNTLVS